MPPRYQLRSEERRANKTLHCSSSFRSSERSRRGLDSQSINIPPLIGVKTWFLSLPDSPFNENQRDFLNRIRTSHLKFLRKTPGTSGFFGNAYLLTISFKRESKK